MSQVSCQEAGEEVAGGAQRGPEAWEADRRYQGPGGNSSFEGVEDGEKGLPPLLWGQSSPSCESCLLGYTVSWDKLHGHCYLPDCSCHSVATDPWLPALTACWSHRGAFITEAQTPAPDSDLVGPGGAGKPELLKAPAGVS